MVRAKFMASMKNLLFILFLSSTLNLFAQPNKLEINGTIHELSGAPLPYVTVLVYNEQDSVLVNGTSSDTLGNFSVPLDKGNYYIKFRFLSYKEKLVSAVVINNQSVNIVTIVLEQKQEFLDGVDIIVEKPQMELKLDKRVFNVTKDISTTGLNAADILDDIPSISVDAEGNVSLRGNQNVQILINGKPRT